MSKIDDIMKLLGNAPSAAPLPVADLQQGTQTGPQSGLNRVQASINRLVTCESCGSTVLYEIKLQQYRPGYSASAGGDIQPSSEAPQSVLACLCGNVIMPNIGGVRGGRTPNAMLANLMECMDRAKKTKADLALSVRNLAMLTVDKEDFLALKSSVDALAAAAPVEEMYTDAVDLVTVREAEDKRLASAELAALSARIAALELISESAAFVKDAVPVVKKKAGRPKKEVVPVPESVPELVEQ